MPLIKRLPFLLLTILIINCSKDDNLDYIPTGQSKEYTILNTDLSDISGTVSFIENTDGSTTISLVLNNTINNVDNPVRLRRSTANVGGELAVSLESIKGKNGTATTTIGKLANGERISYSELVDFNGYIGIEGLNENEGALLAYADLGPNELTGEKVTYNLLSPDGTFNGLATIEERKKGTSALTIGVFGLNESEQLPCSLNILQNNTTDELIHNLSPVKGSLNGFSFNELTEINGVRITYNEVLQLNAYIEVTNQNLTSSYYARGLIGYNAD